MSRVKTGIKHDTHRQAGARRATRPVSAHWRKHDVEEVQIETQKAAEDLILKHNRHR